MGYNERNFKTRTVSTIEPSKSTFSKRVFLCFIVFLFCAAVKFYPGENLNLIRNSISYIVSHNTDVNAEVNKFIDYLKKDASMETLDPVSAMVAPSGGKIIKGFGMQDASGSDFHYGLRLSAEKNENIVSANDGVVSEISKSEEYGSFIVITHSEEITTLYGDLNEIIINVGDKVEKGQAIARANTDTNSFYFELKRNDTYLDPTQFIDFKE